MRFIASILVALPQFVWGQGNIVSNPSFEEHTQCPENISSIYLAVPWTNTGGGSTPDYFHSCCPPEIVPPDTFPRVGLPDNVFGFQHAHTGESYTGIYVYNGPNQEELREYLQVELAQPIYAGVRYRVSFYVSLADKFQHAVGTLGAYFTNAPVINDDWGVYEVEPQIESDGDMVFNDKENWILIEDTFNSRYGGERYMLIGNFRIDSESNVTFVDSGATNTHNRSYYYIDDVSVIALDSIPNSIAEPATELALTLTVWPNPATSLLHIRSGLPLARLRLLDLSGRAVHAQEAHGTTHTIPLHTLPAGLYLLEAEDTTGRKAVQRVVKVT
jgi:hypothetical protein